MKFLAPVDKGNPFSAHYLEPEKSFMLFDGIQSPQGTVVYSNSGQLFFAPADPSGTPQTFHELKCIHTARESLTGRASLRLRHQIDTGIAGEHAVIERVRDLDRGSAGLIGNSFVSSWNAISPEGLSILEDFMGNPSNIVSMPFDRRVLWAGKVAVGSGQDTIVITGLTHYSDPEYVQAFAFQGNEKPRRIPANSNPEKNLKAHRIIIGFESMAELKFEYYDTGQRYMLSADVEEMPHAELEGLLKIGAIPNVQRSPSALMTPFTLDGGPR